MGFGQPASIYDHTAGLCRFRIEHGKLSRLQQDKVSKSGSEKLFEIVHFEWSFAKLHSNVQFRIPVAKIR